MGMTNLHSWKSLRGKQAMKTVLGDHTRYSTLTAAKHTFPLASGFILFLQFPPVNVFLSQQHTKQLVLVFISVNYFYYTRYCVVVTPGILVYTQDNTLLQIDIMNEILRKLLWEMDS